MFLLCAIAFIGIFAAQPVMAADMNPFDTSGSYSNPFSDIGTWSDSYPFSNVVAEPAGNYDWFDGPSESQLPYFFAALGIPYASDSIDWVGAISIPSTGGSAWLPYSNTPSPGISPPLPDWSGEYVTEVGPGGWWSPLTPAV